jgi:UDP-N-acetylmuramoyl-tripeptide--D-alanyl-D-alanine ligase
VDVVVGVGPLCAALLEGARQAGLRPQALHHFTDSAQAAAAAVGLVAAGDALLVKGSRGIHMESIVDTLRDHFGLAEGGTR